jgi:predicted metalloprotease with PDZ domain
MLLLDRKKIKPNFGLPGELITHLVTSNFWLAGAVTSYYAVTIKSVSWS